MSHYEQISDVGRDQKMTELALEAFDELIRRFPDSEYARDAEIKADLARDHLAGKEMEIGRYYLRRGEYVAAINRFNNVIDRYQTTSHTPEALYRLVETYLTLGLLEEAKRNGAVLGYNYPGDPWYGDAYKLHRLTESYLALGVQQEARRTASVLGYNFPGSEWYQDSYSLFAGLPQ